VPEKQRLVVIDIKNPDALRRGSRIVLDLADDNSAMEIAQKLADATGRAVILRNADMIEIHTIPAAPIQ
jgi:hypothetical protein